LTALERSEASGVADAVFDRRLTWSVVIAALLLFIPLLIPLSSGRVFTLDDLSSFHLPLRYLYQNALKGGHSVLWTSCLFSGFYVHAEGQIGAFHPLHLLLYSALPLTIAFNLELILSYAFAFAGMWQFLKYVGFTAASSVVGAIAFAFSGFALLHLPHMNAIAVIAHVPWLLLAIDLAVSDTPDTRRKGLVSIALLFASQALLGYPQYVWMSALICALYGLVCSRAPALRLLPAGIASVAGLMLAGIQLVPSLDLLKTSERSTVATAFALSYSLHPLNILQLFSPYLLMNRIYAAPDERLIHEFGVYSGALATIALAWTAVRWKDLPFRRLAVFAIATSVTGLLLALGRYGLGYEWVTALPLVGKFRAPARHVVLLHFGLAVLVAILFEDLRRLCLTRSKVLRRQTWLWVPVLISVCAAAVAWLRPQVWETFPDQPLYAGGMLFGVMLLAFVTTLVGDAARGSRSALMLLPCVLAIDVGLWGYAYVFAGEMHTIDELAELAEPPNTEPGSTVHQTARTRNLNALVFHDLRVLRPYVGLRPARRLTLVTDSELRVSGAQWVSGESGWSRVADPMPRVRFVPRWTVVNDPGALSGIDVRQTALVSEDPRATQGIDARARLVVDEPGRLLVDVSTRDSALLVTTEAYDLGWTATGRSDGVKLKILPVYGDYLGVVVEPGDYRMSLTFAPKSITTGVYTSLSGLIVVAFVVVLSSWKR
jgi:hypothetical protein